MEDHGFNDKLTRLLDALRARILKEHQSAFSRAIAVGGGGLRSHDLLADPNSYATQQHNSHIGADDLSPAMRLSKSKSASKSKSITFSDKDIERRVPSPIVPSPVACAPPSPPGPAPQMRLKSGVSTDSVTKPRPRGVSWKGDTESTAEAGADASPPGVPRHSPRGVPQEANNNLIESPASVPPECPSISHCDANDQQDAMMKSFCDDASSRWTPVKTQAALFANTPEPTKSKNIEDDGEEAFQSPLQEIQCSYENLACVQNQEQANECKCGNLVFDDASLCHTCDKKKKETPDLDSDSTGSVREADTTYGAVESTQSIMSEEFNYYDEPKETLEECGNNLPRLSDVEGANGVEQSTPRRSIVGAALWRKASVRTKFVATFAAQKRTRFHDEGSAIDVEEISASSHEDDDDDDDDIDDDKYDYEHPHFWLSPLWVHSTEMSARKTVKTRTRNLDKPFDGNRNSAIVAGVDHANSIFAKTLQMCVASPNRPPRLAWDFIGCLLFCYDAIVIPLQFFRLPRVTFLVAMSWIVRLYWTADIPFSFFTGTLKSNGQVDMNMSRIATKYIKTWLLFDFVLVLLDWSELVGGMKEFAVARVGKVVKTIRMLRMFRFFKLMRTAHVPEALKGWTYMFRSEKVLILFSMVRIMVAMIWVTHFIACFWYAIGKGDSGARNWLVQHDYTNNDLGYLYTTSFHWSLTLFHGSMDIQPHNVAERTYSICTLLVAFVFASFAVSSITTSMTQLQIVTAKQSTEMAALRGFLSNNGISKKLAMRIQRSAENAAAELKRNAPENTVELMNLVSEPLRIELHYEVNAIILTHHPLFFFYDQACQSDMRVLCHTAMDKLSISSGDMLFSPGKMAEEPKMFFVTDGDLIYISEDDTQNQVGKEQWACEAVLWTSWYYRGTMHATNDTRLLLLDAIKFQRLASKGLTPEANILHYGKRFVKHLNNTPRMKLTDLQDDLDLYELAQQAFPFLDLREANAKHGNNTTSGMQSLPLGALFGNDGTQNRSSRFSISSRNACERGALRISVQSSRSDVEEIRIHPKKGKDKQKLSDISCTDGPSD